jgi:hypothetical protein
VGTTRRFALGITALLLSLPCTLIGCGDDPARSEATGAVPAPIEPAPGIYVSARWGYSVRIPPGWHRAERPITPLTDPVETLVVATYRPSPGQEGCGQLAFRGFDSNEALVIVLERGLDPESAWPDFPPRPARFAFEAGQSSDFSECLPTTEGIPRKAHWFRFTDAGRHFHVLVAIGGEAPSSADAEAYGLLDSLEFDPSVKPDWRSSDQ